MLSPHSGCGSLKVVWLDERRASVGLGKGVMDHTSAAVPNDGMEAAQPSAREQPGGSSGQPGASPAWSAGVAACRDTRSLESLMPARNTQPRPRSDEQLHDRPMYRAAAAAGREMRTWQELAETAGSIAGL